MLVTLSVNSSFSTDDKELIWIKRCVNKGGKWGNKELTNEFTK